MPHSLNLRHSHRVILTGASGGIGSAIARRLGEEGYGLDLLYSSDESRERGLDCGIRELSQGSFTVDLSRPESISAFTEAYTSSAWGLVNCAGICKTLRINDSSSLDPLNEVLSVNLIGAYLLTRGVLPKLTRPGRIINISSQLGQEGRAGYSAYCASKFGLIGMTKCWAKELGTEGITVNSVSPGWVDTEMSKRDIERMADEQGMSTDSFRAEICKPLELRRFNSPAEVANLVSFLLSQEASGITGRDFLMQTVWNQE